jgi:inhibitor of Bruton tyrosine kinase
VKTVSDLPILTRYRPIIIKDVVLSKLHSAILTNDPESNLYLCGFGPGGRLGMGDETTRFNYVCVGGGLAGKKIIAVALGQNHSVAVSSDGAIFTWGMNTWGQLGYSLPRPVAKDEDPINTSPRQIFGPLKREVVLGVAASTIHSVAYTSSSLYTFGKNEGQLGLMDSHSRSLEAQTVPRR